MAEEAAESAEVEAPAPEASETGDIAVVADHGWRTLCPVLADGTAWYSANYAGTSYTPGDRCCATPLGRASGVPKQYRGPHRLGVRRVRPSRPAR